MVANELWQFAELHTPASDVAAYTQAMMDLGATVCTRTKPACAACPLGTDCMAHQMRRQTDFPGRKARKTKPLKKTKMVLLHSHDAVYLERRPSVGIWGGLWSLPELGPDQEAPDWCDAQLNLPVTESQRWETVRHSFTHFDLDIEPIAVRVEDVSSRVQDTQDQIWYQLESPPNVGLAAPVAGLIEKLRTRSAQENVPNR
jgi:A/G-specific adenine glycosylase